MENEQRYEIRFRCEIRMGGSRNVYIIYWYYMCPWTISREKQQDLAKTYFYKWCVFSRVYFIMYNCILSMVAFHVVDVVSSVTFNENGNIALCVQSVVYALYEIPFNIFYNLYSLDNYFMYDLRAAVSECNVCHCTFDNLLRAVTARVYLRYEYNI